MYVVVPSITKWAQTCQTVVDAIRKAGATEHYITLPGNGYTSAGTFVPSGSAKALARVKDADGSTDKLIFEVHKYLDEDNSGTHLDCVSNNIDAFEDLTKFLKDNKRQAILAETGGGPSTKSCLKNVCELLSYLNDNDDVYMGYLGWGAGSFDETYELSLTPEGGEGKGPMKDVPLMRECFIKQFDGGAGTGGSYSGGNSTTNQTSSSNSISSGSYGGSSDQTSADSTSDNSANGGNGGSSSGPSSSGSPHQSSGNNYGGSQGDSAESTPPQSPSTGSQESTPDVVQTPGSPAGGATKTEHTKSANQQGGGNDNLDIADQVNELGNEDEAGDDECAADDGDDEVVDAAAGDENDSQNNNQSETNTQEENNPESDNETQDENNTDDSNNTDNSYNTEDSSPDPQPQPTTNPRPSSTFATSYIPAPTGFNNTSSASNSSGTEPAINMDMGGESMDGDSSSSSSSSEPHDDGSDDEEGTGGEDMTTGDGSYA
ncbi:MAG: hypothetical protein Q9204_008285 [Flavoplaca sp. TL-2023a]